MTRDRPRGARSPEECPARRCHDRRHAFRTKGREWERAFLTRAYGTSRRPSWRGNVLRCALLLHQLLVGAAAGGGQRWSRTFTSIWGRKQGKEVSRRCARVSGSKREGQEGSGLPRFTGDARTRRRSPADGRVSWEGPGGVELAWVRAKQRGRAGA